MVGTATAPTTKKRGRKPKTEPLPLDAVVISDPCGDVAVANTNDAAVPLIENETGNEKTVVPPSADVVSISSKELLEMREAQTQLMNSLNDLRQSLGEARAHVKEEDNHVRQKTEKKKEEEEEAPSAAEKKQALRAQAIYNARQSMKDARAKAKQARKGVPSAGVVAGAANDSAPREPVVAKKETPLSRRPCRERLYQTHNTGNTKGRSEVALNRTKGSSKPTHDTLPLVRNREMPFHAPLYEVGIGGLV